MKFCEMAKRFLNFWKKTLLRFIFDIQQEWFFMNSKLVIKFLVLKRICKSY